MSLNFIYEGRRKSLKINQNAPVINILQDVRRGSFDYHFFPEYSKNISIFYYLQEFNILESTGCSLKHKKIILDPSQPFRFSGVPLNAEIEVVLNKTTNTLNSNSPSRLAISIEGSTNGSFTETLASSFTLHDVLSHLIDIGKLSQVAFSQDPEIIFIRQKFQGESLSSTTLSSIGLAGYVQ